MGIGVQGAVYRIHVTLYGDSIIFITSDIGYVTSGRYTGKTALSVILWVLGTLILALTTIFGLGYAPDPRQDYFSQISIGLLASCACYLFSSMAQYGLFFIGPAGVAIPAGIVLIVFWVLVFNKYPGIPTALLLSLRRDD